MRWHQIMGSSANPALTQTAMRHPRRPDDDTSAHHMIETDTIKPSGPLNADELRKKSDRRARVQQQIRDEDARHTAKTQDLKTRLTRP